MDLFHKLMNFLGVYNQNIDFISDLPIEISQMILSKLDPQSMLNAALVSHKWLAVVKSTKPCRQTIRRHLRRRQRKLKPVLPPKLPNRSTIKNPPVPYISISQPQITCETFQNSNRLVTSKRVSTYTYKSLKFCLRI